MKALIADGEKLRALTGVDHGPFFIEDDMRVKLSNCLDCGHHLDGATGLGNYDPQPGAITICMYCGHIMAFADDMSLRPLTDDEVRDVAGDPRILAAQRMRGLM